MNEINYTIIIPHKNIPSLLQRCIDSIPYREDLQVIVVDDNSECDKVDFEHFPGLKEKHVEVVFTKEGKGAGYARNIGLRHAKGKWILFADADDFFNTCFLETIDKYCNSNYEIIYFGINSVYSDNLEIANRAHYINDYIKNDLEQNSTFENSRFKRYSPWAKLISRIFIEKHNISFEERKASNDIWFSILSGYHAKNVYADITPIYCLTIRKGSLEMTINHSLYEERFSAACNVNDFLYKNNLNKYHFNLWRYLIVYRRFGIKLFIRKFFEICIHYKSHYDILIKDLYLIISELINMKRENRIIKSYYVINKNKQYK